MPKESTPLHTGIIKIFSESSFYSSSSSPPSLSSQISPHTTSQEQDDVKFLCQPSSSKPLQSVSDSSTTPFHLEPDHRYASICNVFLPSCPQRKQTFQTSKTPQGLSSPSLPTMGRHKGESQGQEVELGGQGRQSPNSRRTLPLKFVFLRSYMLCRLILMTFPFLGNLTTVTYPHMCGSGPPSLPPPSARCRSCAPDLPALGRPCL